MGENLYNSDHIANSKTYRKNYDTIDWTKKVDVAYVTLISGKNRLHTFTILKSEFSKEYAQKLMNDSGADGYELNWSTIPEDVYLEKIKEN